MYLSPPSSLSCSLLSLLQEKAARVFCLPSAAPPIFHVSCGLRTMGARWIPALVGGRAPFSGASSSFARVRVLLKKTRRRRLLEDGIRFFPPSPHPNGVSSIVGGCVEVCLRRISRDLVGGCLWWIRSDLVFVRLCSCVFRLDSSDLKLSSSAAVAVLGCWSYGTLARRLPDSLLQQVLPGSAEGWVMTAGLDLVIIVVARWSTNPDVIFIILVFIVLS